MNVYYFMVSSPVDCFYSEVNDQGVDPECHEKSRTNAYDFVIAIGAVIF
jgi:hypothetical protein